MKVGEGIMLDRVVTILWAANTCGDKEKIEDMIYLVEEFTRGGIDPNEMMQGAQNVERIQSARMTSTALQAIMLGLEFDGKEYARGLLEVEYREFISLHELAQKL